MGSPSSPLSPILSPGQLQALAAVGEERTAAEGEFLFRIGDARYPFIVVLEGEAAILDGAGNEIARQGPGGFLAEMNLLTGQTVYVDGVVTEPMRYIAVDRDDLRPLLFEDAALADVLLNTFIRRREILQQREGVGFEVIGPRSSAATRHLLDYARRGRLPHVWRDTERDDDLEAACRRRARTGRAAAGPPAGRDRASQPQQRPALASAGNRTRARAPRGGRPGGDRRRSGGSRRGRVRGLRGARDPGRGKHSPRRPSRSLTPDRELSRVSGGDQRHRVDRPRDHAGAQVRRPDGDALPRARARAGQRLAPNRARGRPRDRRSRHRDRHRRRLPAPTRRRPRGLRGLERLLRRRPA